MQNWLKSKSPEYQNFLAQQQKENEFRQNTQDLAQTASADTHARSGLEQEQGQFNLNQAKRQFHLMTYDPQNSFGNDESVPSGHDVGQEQGPPSPLESRPLSKIRSRLRVNRLPLCRSLTRPRPRLPRAPRTTASTTIFTASRPGPVILAMSKPATRRPRSRNRIDKSPL